jgi:Domain of unknown function (DUF397)
VTGTSPLLWRKSSHSSDQGECVEVTALPSGSIGVRDSKNPEGPRLTLTRRTFRTFLQTSADACTPRQ